MLRGFLLGVVLSLALLFGLATPVCAIGNPDSITVESVRIFQNLWETGDQLYVVEHKIMYASDPDEDPGDTFLVGLWQGSTQVYSKPVNYYAHNVVTIYLTPTQALTWEGSYSIKVMGNPAYFPTLTEGTNMRTLELSGGHWVSGTQEESRAYLQAWVVHLAEVFEASWPGEVDLLTAADTLNEAGAAVFKEAIPGLETICSGVFAVSVGYPEMEEPAFTGGAYQEKLRERVGTRLTGALNGLGTFLHMPGFLVGGVGLGILYFVLAGRILVATGSVPSSIIVSLPFLLAGNYVGLIPLVITFTIGLVVLVLAGAVFILGRLG